MENISHNVDPACLRWSGIVF